MELGRRFVRLSSSPSPPPAAGEGERMCHHPPPLPFGPGSPLSYRVPSFLTCCSFCFVHRIVSFIRRLTGFFLEEATIAELKLWLGVKRDSAEFRKHAERELARGAPYGQSGSTVIKERTCRSDEKDRLRKGNRRSRVRNPLLLARGLCIGTLDPQP